MFTSNSLKHKLCWLVINLIIVTSLQAFLPAKNSTAAVDKNPDKITNTTDSKNTTNYNMSMTNTLLIDVKKDFGAKGDGTTDDTANIQKALNNGNGKNVFFPEGSYLVTGKLSLPDNVNIYGDGIEKSKLISSSGNIFYVLLSRKSVRISEMSFVGNGTGDNSSLLEFKHMTDLIIQNCYFEKSNKKSIQIQFSSNISILNCEVNSGGSGFTFADVDGLIIKDCYIHDTDYIGISVTRNSVNTVGCNNFKILNNRCILNKVAGISITGNSHDFTIDGNICNNNGGSLHPEHSGMQDGINGHRLKNGVISNNVCIGNAGSGISIDGQDEGNNISCQNVIISKNNCEKNKRQGIYLYYTQYCTVDNNICMKNEGLGGIALTGATYNTISNNRSHDNGIFGGARNPDFILETGADYNTLDKNVIGSIERNDEQNDIVIRSTNNYIGTIDYSHFKWGSTPGKKPIYITDLLNQKYLSDIVKTFYHHDA